MRSKNVMDIPVDYKIGDFVVNKRSKKRLQIIGYEFIQGRGLKYAVVVDDSDERKYYYGFELEGQSSESSIGFSYS